jgi:UDP-N-acetylmuramate--alanine ligase
MDNKLLTAEYIKETNMGRVEAIHFVGIGGVGMSGIAELLHNLGYQVTGSDISRNANVVRLESQNIDISIGHKGSNIKNADVVVVSSAIDKTNPEIVTAFENGVPVIPRAEMLAELMRFRYGIAVAGTHGKTTTTSLIASILAAGELDPTFVIGGKLTSAGTNARLGEGKFLVAEADESDASFLHLQPIMAVVTNIDMDHMDTYGSDYEKLKDAFNEFLHHLPFYGLAVLCNEDDAVKELMPKIGKPKISYGYCEGSDVRAINLLQNGQKTSFDVIYRGQEFGSFELNMPGKHNVLNSLAAIVIAKEAGVGLDAIKNALKEFKGIGRRFQMYEGIRINGKNITLIDDYAHHPREIEATLEGIRSGWPGNRLCVVFQPHRYSRTRDLLDDFANVLSKADVVIITDVYAAGEEPIPEADGRTLTRAIRTRSNLEPIFVDSIDEVENILNDVVLDGDIVAALGAGDIGKFVPYMVEKYHES